MDIAPMLLPDALAVVDDAMALRELDTSVILEAGAQLLGAAFGGGSG